MLGEGCSQLAVPWAPAPEFGVCVTSMPSSRGFQEFGITSLACPPRQFGVFLISGTRAGFEGILSLNTEPQG